MVSKMMFSRSDAISPSLNCMRRFFICAASGDAYILALALLSARPDFSSNVSRRRFRASVSVVRLRSDAFTCRLFMDRCDASNVSFTGLESTS